MTTATATATATSTRRWESWSPVALLQSPEYRVEARNACGTGMLWPGDHCHGFL